MYIPVILGTARAGRESVKAANFVLGRLKESGAKTSLQDVRDYRIKATDNSGKSDEAKKLKHEIVDADGLVIVSPEYNHTFPGELKMMLDMLFEEYRGKHVAICGVSAGKFGGARCVEQLKMYCVSLGMKPVLRSVYFCNIEDLFASGEITDKMYVKRTDRLIEDLKKEIG